jgi:hypothetical protein
LKYQGFEGDQIDQFALVDNAPQHKGLCSSVKPQVNDLPVSMLSKTLSFDTRIGSG